jgi:hypothetical protein
MKTITPPRKNTPLRAGRRLILIDIENVIGHPYPTTPEICAARTEVLAALESTTGHIVIGTCHGGLLELAVGWPGPRYVVRSGVNGADLALIDVLSEDIARRFETLVIVSGDGIFADPVAALGNDGVRTHVIARPTRLSARLRLAAHTITPLPSPPVGPTPTTAASPKAA